MNVHSSIHAPAEAVGTLFDATKAKERANFRSLALQLRRNSHMQRRWAREAKARGQTTAVQGFTITADRYAADALWYFRRSRNGERA